MWSAYFKVPDYTSILKSNTFVLWIMQIIYANMGQRNQNEHIQCCQEREGVWIMGDFHFLSLFYTSLL